MKIEERKKKRMKMTNYSKVKRNFLLLQFQKEKVKKCLKK